MRPLLKPYAVVRVRDLARAEGDYDGWGVNLRPPAIGDVGVLVNVLRVAGASNRYLVENCDTDGITIWLGEFDEDELETM